MIHLKCVHMKGHLCTTTDWVYSVHSLFFKRLGLKKKEVKMAFSG